MFKSKNLPLTISLVVVISLVVGWGIHLLMAAEWTGPSCNPPGDCNTAAPISTTVGDARYLQLAGGTMTGNLTVGGNLTASGKIDTPGIKLTGNYSSGWGGWNYVMQIDNASHGMIHNSAGAIGFGLHSNSNFYWANTSAGTYPMTLSNTGNLTVGGTISGSNYPPASCAAGSSIRVISATGTVTCETDDAGGGLPSGMIAMFAGACPSGWTELTGYQGKFVRGGTAAQAAAGTTGGQDTHTHSFSQGTSSDGAHTHTVGSSNSATGGTSSNHNHAGVTTGGGTTAGQSTGHTHNYVEAAKNTGSAGAHTHSVSGNTGSGDNIPSYINVVFCKKD